MTFEKKYTYKVLNQAGTLLLGVWENSVPPSFDKIINAGLGILEITLPRKFDNYNSDGTIDYCNRVEIWVQDRDTVGTGRRIYTGFISDIVPKIKGGQEEVTVTMFGYATRFADCIDWDGTSIKMVRNSQDPKDIFEDIIDKFRSNELTATGVNPPINYSATSVESLGSNISLTTDSKFVFESLEKLRLMTGADWFYYVDADDIIWFKSKPNEATHKFTLGRDFSDIEIIKSQSDVKNTLFFWNGLQQDDPHFLSKRYYNSASVSRYWTKAERMTDSRITSSTYAQQLGTAYINANKDPNISLILRIIDNNLDDSKGYDIESIEPGQTCKLLNLDDTDLYSGNLLISKVSYTPEGVDLTVEDKRNLTGRELSDIRKQLEDAVYSDGISTISSVSV